MLFNNSVELLHQPLVLLLLLFVVLLNLWRNTFKHVIQLLTHDYRLITLHDLHFERLCWLEEFLEVLFVGTSFNHIIKELLPESELVDFLHLILQVWNRVKVFELSLPELNLVFEGNGGVKLLVETEEFLKHLLDGFISFGPFWGNHFEEDVFQGFVVIGLALEEFEHLGDLLSLVGLEVGLRKHLQKSDSQGELVRNLVVLAIPVIVRLTERNFRARKVGGSLFLSEHFQVPNHWGVDDVVQENVFWLDVSMDIFLVDFGDGDGDFNGSIEQDLEQVFVLGRILEGSVQILLPHLFGVRENGDLLLLVSQIGELEIALVRPVQNERLVEVHLQGLELLQDKIEPLGSFQQIHIPNLDVVLRHRGELVGGRQAVHE